MPVRPSRRASLVAILAIAATLTHCRNREPGALVDDPPAGSPRDAAAWWIDTYGVAPATTPHLARAEAVFARVAAAADKRGNRLPRLVVLNADGSPYAVAIRDGSVLLTRGALELCYGKAQDIALGDIRLAFVVGHELAHLAGDHFWHASAFATVERGGSSPREPDRKRRRSLVELFERSSAEPARAELQADETGLMFLTMAGYDPRPLVEPDRVSFFEEWTGDLPHDAAFAADPAHPTPAARAEFLRQRLSEVADDVPLFHFGTRLLEMGRHKDAILLLERFGERFAGREVQNNLGVAHFQLALQRLAACDGSLLTHYRLPVEIDRETLAERTIRRGGYASPCLEDPMFRAEVREASARLETAVERDPTYRPARRNLVALFLVSDQPARALAQAEDLEKLAPQDPDAIAAAALALHVYGLRSNVDTADRALSHLESALLIDAQHAEALYNRAVFLTERRRSEAARGAWKTFLMAEGSSPYAEVARGWLGLRVSFRAMTPPAVATPPLEGSPCRRGPIDPDTAATLAKARAREFTIGDLRGATYEWREWRALRLGDTIEIVERIHGARLTE